MSAVDEDRVLPGILCPTAGHPPPEMLDDDLVVEATGMFLRTRVVEIDDDGKVDLILVTHDARGRRAVESAMRNAVFQGAHSPRGQPGGPRQQVEEAWAAFTPEMGDSPPTPWSFSNSAGDSNQRIDSVP